MAGRLCRFEGWARSPDTACRAAIDGHSAPVPLQFRNWDKNPLLHVVDQDQLLERYGGSNPFIFDGQLYVETAASVLPRLNSSSQLSK